MLVRAARAGVAAPWLARSGLVLSVAATLAANVAYGAPDGAVGAAISGWPAAAFLICAETAIGMLRRDRPDTGDAPQVCPWPRPAPIMAAPVATTDSTGHGGGHQAVSDRPAAPVTRRPRTRPAARPRNGQKGGHGRRSAADIEAAALAAMAAHPDITGAQLGRAVGVSERTGRRLLAQLGARAGGHGSSEEVTR